MAGDIERTMGVPGPITVKQIVISFYLGLLATPAYFFGVMPFDVKGQPVPLKGVESGAAAVALCLAVCQFLVVSRSGHESDVGPETGIIGVLAGAALAKAITKRSTRK